MFQAIDPDRRMHFSRRRNADCVHLSKQLLVIGERRGTVLGTDRLGPIAQNVGHADQVDTVQLGIDPGMMLAQVPDPNDSNPQHSEPLWELSTQRRRDAEVLSSAHFCILNSSKFSTTGLPTPKASDTCSVGSLSFPASSASLRLCVNLILLIQLPQS